MQAMTTNEAGANAPLAQNARIPFGHALYNEVMQFLIDEANLLDDGMFKDWLSLLSDDFQVHMPVRSTCRRARGSGVSKSMVFVHDDKAAVAFRVERLMGDSAWADDPPSRMRRMVSNLSLHATGVEGEYLARNNILMHRNRGNEQAFQVFSARREDVVRRAHDGLVLASRNVFVDQVVLGMANLGFFL
jgi:3-phenylpropionate/cinnamic acid dioxygenase small subunit